ncbi:MAG: metallophosphoesterase [Acidimicrobiia bacterium]|nr:metallophosphoesterase [Acidimicrobiia bacterium]
MSDSEGIFQQEIDRRRFLRHAAWAGAAVGVAVTGGIVTTELTRGGQHQTRTSDFTFAQISDSHLGFEGKANPDVASTFQQSIDAVNAMPDRPDFVIHTGDVTHFSTVGQFDQAKQMMSVLRTGQVLVLPGEHDAVDDEGQKYLGVFGQGTQGTGWFSFDHKGVHFVALVNTTGQQVLGHLGADQLAWLKNDVRRLSAETPIVVFSHIPLFQMYTPWGWGTDDAPQALALLHRFGSVTCLNGHVHQIMSRTEGKVDFHTCAATAYPLPRPGTAPAPNPVTVPSDQLHRVIGTRDVAYSASRRRTSYVDRSLG